LKNLPRAASRRRKSLAPPPAGFVTARWRASWNCLTPAEMIDGGAADRSINVRHELLCGT